MGLRWCMITLLDKLNFDYRVRIESIQKEYPITFDVWTKKLNQNEHVGGLPMWIISDFLLFDIIKDYKEAYDMFCTKEQYEAEWAEYVEDKTRYEAQLEMEGEDNE